MAERVDAVASDHTGPRPFSERLDTWRQILAQGNVPEGRSIDGVSRWLLITRAAVFSMTITSALIGASRPAQIDDAVGALWAAPLAQDEQAAIEGILGA